MKLVEWIGNWIGRELKLEPSQISPDKVFVSYGMDSVHAMMLVGDLEEHLGRRLSPTLAWDHPTPAALAKFLAQGTPEFSLAKAADADADILARLDDLSEEEIDRLLNERLSGAVVK